MAAHTKSTDKTADALGADEVQDAVNDETEQGFHGVKVDPTPNEHYTVAGVIAGKPTPETDPALAGARAAQAHITDLETPNA